MTITIAQSNMVDLWQRIIPRYENQIRKQVKRSFKFSQVMTDGEDTLHIDFQARKRKGAIFGDKVSIICTYNHGPDSYTLTIRTFNGSDLSDNTVAVYPDMYVDNVADPEAVLHELARF